MKKIYYLIIEILALLTLLIVCNSASASTEHETIYYFNSYSTGTVWEFNPANMVDNNLATYSHTTIEGDIQLLNGNNCSGSGYGTIKFVYIRAYASDILSQATLILTPQSNIGDGDEHLFPVTSSFTWSQWFNITEDTNMPATWSFSGIDGLNCLVESFRMRDDTLACAKVEIKIVVSNDVPYATNLEPNYSNCWDKNNNMNFTLIDIDNDEIEYHTFIYSMPNNILVFNQSGKEVSNNTIVNMDVSNNLTNGTIYKWVINTSDYYDSSSSTTYFGTLCNYTCPDVDESINDNAIVNLTLNNESWVNVHWYSWFNDSVSDTLETILSIDSQFINTSGNGGCIGIVWVNYSDENVTFNVSVDKSDNSNTSTYEVNDNNWLYLSGLELELSTFFIMIILTLLILGIEKKDSVIGFLCCFSSGFISFTAMATNVTPSEWDLVLVICIFVAISIGVYKAWLFKSEIEKDL